MPRSLPRLLATWAPLPFLLLILTYPLCSDNAVYQSMAYDWIHFAKFPYMGSWDHNFPGNVVVHAIGILLFGPSDLGFRLFDLLLQLAACLLLFRLWSVWLRARTAWIAVMLYVFYYVHASSFVVGQRDFYGMFLVLWGTYRILRTAKPDRFDLLYCGILFGLAVAIRPTYAVYELALIITLPQVRQPKAAAIICIASILPCALVIILYSFIPGGIPALYESTIRFNLDLYTKFGGSMTWLFNGLFRTLIVIVPFLAVLIPTLRRKTVVRESFHDMPNNSIRTLYWAYFVLTLLLILVQRKFLSYHFAPYIILQTPLAAIGAEVLLSYLKKEYRIAAFVMIGIVAVIPVQRITEIVDGGRAGQRNLLEALDSAEYPGANTGYTSAKKVCEHLRSAVEAGKRIEVAGFDAKLRAWLRANSATRFTMLQSIGLRTDPHKIGEQYFTSYQHAWRQEYMDSLRTVAPAYIVLERYTDYWYLLDPYTDVLHNLPGFDSFFSANYRYDTAYGGFQIYQRKNP